MTDTFEAGQLAGPSGRSSQNPDGLGCPDCGGTGTLMGERCGDGPGVRHFVDCRKPPRPCPHPSHQAHSENTANPDGLDDLFDRVESVLTNVHISYPAAARRVLGLVREFRSTPKNTATLESGSGTEPNEHL